MDVNVVVIIFQGLIDDVVAFQNGKEAERFWEEEVGLSYEEYRKRKETEDTEAILGNYDGSEIYELTVK